MVLPIDKERRPLRIRNRLQTTINREIMNKEIRDFMDKLEDDIVRYQRRVDRKEDVEYYAPMLKECKEALAIMKRATE